MRIEHTIKKAVTGSTHRSHEVAALIERAILNGKYPIGDRLPPESTFCEKYKVSRTVVREALKQLVGRGIIVTLNGSGSYASAVPTEQIGDTFHRVSVTNNKGTVRAAIELWAILHSSATSLYDSENIKIQPLEEVVAKIKHSIETSDTDGFSKARIEFYRVLAKNTQNALIEEIQRAVEPLIAKETPIILTNNEKRNKLIENYESIVADFKTGNFAKAGETLREIAFGLSHNLQFLL